MAGQEPDVAFGMANDAARVVMTGCDGAVDAQVLDGGSIDKSEWSTAFGVGMVVYGQLVPIAIKGAAEGMTIGTHAGSDGDVAGQLDVLAAERHSQGHASGKDVPLIGAGNDVGIGLCTIARDASVGQRGGDKILLNGGVGMYGVAVSTIGVGIQLLAIHS